MLLIYPISKQVYNQILSDLSLKEGSLVERIYLAIAGACPAIVTLEVTPSFCSFGLRKERVYCSEQE